MSEKVPKFTIHEYASDVISVIPKGQTIKWIDTVHLGVHVLEEYEPKGTQILKTEDIIEEINKLPTNIRKHISSVVLSPYTHPYRERFTEKSEEESLIIASGDHSKKQITIYAAPYDRNFLKDALKHLHTLAHEAGHIIDGETQSIERFFAYTPQWTKAMCEDSKVTRTRPDMPPYFVSQYAEDNQRLVEDFADSVMYFSEDRSRACLKENFPNRYKFLEELLGTE